MQRKNTGLCAIHSRGNFQRIAARQRTAFYFELKRKGERISFLLSDNGKGTDEGQLKKGFGLKGMTARAEAFGGEISFESEPGEGFEIHISLPADNL